MCVQAAIEGLSESLRRELMLFGIDVVSWRRPVKNADLEQGQEAFDISRYQNSPYLPLCKGRRLHAAA